MVDLLTADAAFPLPHEADPEGLGLVAIGGELSSARLLSAYRQGIFPWFNEGEPVCWWSPQDRCIIDPHEFSPSHSLLRNMKKFDYQVRIDRHFSAVIQQCAAPRSYSQETWISSDIIEQYTALHELGVAHSIEIWDGTDLVGGLYGLSLGRCFFGESMFNNRLDCSKMAFYVLMLICDQNQCPWVDCQIVNEHLLRLGAKTLNREDFLKQLAIYQHYPDIPWSIYQAMNLSTRTIAQSMTLS